MKPSPDEPKLAPPTDEEIVARFQAGDKEAFDDLVHRYQKRVFSLARRLSASEEDAEEVLQETFLQAFRNLDKFRKEAQFGTWLFRVAVNAARMKRRAEKLRAGVSLEECLPRFDHTGRLERMDLDYGRAGSADVLVEREELTARVMEALSRLPDPYRLPLVLRDLEGLSTDQVAEILETTPPLVRTRIHRARLMLRGFLGRLVGGEE